MRGTPLPNVPLRPVIGPLRAPTCFSKGQLGRVQIPRTLGPSRRPRHWPGPRVDTTPRLPRLGSTTGPLPPGVRRRSERLPRPSRALAKPGALRSFIGERASFEAIEEAPGGKLEEEPGPVRTDQGKGPTRRARLGARICRSGIENSEVRAWRSRCRVELLR